MCSFFKHISDNTLTELSFDNLIPQGFDIDKVDQELGTTPLLWAYDKGNKDAVKFLLEHGANIDGEDGAGNTLGMRAHERNDVYVKLLLSQYEGRREYLQRWKEEREEYQKLVALDVDDLSNQKVPIYKTLEMLSFTLDPLEPEYPALRNLVDQITMLQYHIMRRTIERLIAADPALKVYPELLSLIENITVLTYNMDLDGGNTDDKFESATIELVITNNKHRLVYSYSYNWSYNDVQLHLSWHTNGKEILIWDIIEKYDIASFSLEDHGIHLRCRNKSQWWQELKDLWNQFDPIGVFHATEYAEVHDEYESYIQLTFTRLEAGESFDQLNAWISYVAKYHMGMSKLSDEYIAQFVHKLQKLYVRYKAS